MLRLKKAKTSPACRPQLGRKDRRQSNRVDHQVLVYVAEREHCALAADQIVMDKDAILGPVDPQLIEQNRSLPAVSLVNIPRLKPWEQIDDATVVMIDQAKKSLQQTRHMVKTLLEGKMPPQAIDRIVDRLTSGQITHDYPIFPDEAQRLGLAVSTNMPEQVYKLMALYPQPGGKSTSRAG